MAVPTIKSSGPRQRKLTPSHVIRLARRLLVVVAAVLYIVVSLQACADTFRLLQSTEMPTTNYLLYESKLIGQYAGETTLRASPMLAALQGDTTPRSGSLFLEAHSTHFTGCASFNESSIYQDAFQRSMFAAVVSSLTYNLTFLDPKTIELIMPVIDCTFTSLVTSDNTAPRFFYLMRSVSDHDDVYLLSVMMSVQEYQNARQRTSGAAAVATIAIVNDVRANDTTHDFALALGYPFQSPVFQVYTYYGETPDGLWLLKSVPHNPLIEASKIVSTSCPTGLNLLVLLALVYYNLRLGKFWIGDAFAAVSSTHDLRSILVLVSWYVGEWWALVEFTLFTGNDLAKKHVASIYPSIMRADLMSLYITFASILGQICKERVDPAVTLGLFFLGFEGRFVILKWFPGMVNTLIAYADYEFILGVRPLDPTLPEISPLRVWNSKVLPAASAKVVLSGLFPVFATLVFIVVYIALRKVYHHFYPNQLAKQRSSVSSIKERSTSIVGARSNLTQFEFATGVALLDRFGVVSDYDNYVFFKAMRFASADGIYTSGFVIANGKFLVHMDDLNAIIVMKLMRARVKNVYVYEVDGHTVKQTARLVYPETMSFHDIFHLNVKILL
uniref:Transmembrane protein n=1 Tax=Globisporangium ultimum (strain ATCC 200006 / CBS 805.95 / DAOM BR144) TaxID=431595 RepID=K3WZY5_GLOUD